MLNFLYSEEIYECNMNNFVNQESKLAVLNNINFYVNAISKDDARNKALIIIKNNIEKIKTRLWITNLFFDDVHIFRIFEDSLEVKKYEINKQF